LKKSYQTKAQVQALFLDYDGTISPLNVPRSESKVSSEKMEILYRVSRHIPVAVITTKDLPFVTKRTPFAHAWSGIGGLEMKIRDTVTKASCLKKVTPYLTAAVKYAKDLSHNCLIIEEKRDSQGSTVAFSVDWRQAKNICEAEEAALKITSYCKTLPVETIQYEGQPFFDVFPCPVDKGKALSTLKRKLGLRHGILYMGDSSLDNPAFDLADIALGVLHEETTKLNNLTCDYFVKFDDVTVFLKRLLKNGFYFSSELSIILNRTEAVQHIQRRNFT